MRKINFTTNEYYHVYNRGTEKRSIFIDKNDIFRFLDSLRQFNVQEPIGSIYENSFRHDKQSIDDKPMVEIISYCLNPNHFHLLLQQKTDEGIPRLMQRLGTGYTKYFNTRYKRSGALFQGVFKATHVTDNDYLLHLSVYINLNPQAHQLGSEASKLVKSSWEEYLGLLSDKQKISNPKIILEQFKNQKEYEEFAHEALEIIKENKEFYRDLE